MITEATAVTLRQNLGDMLNRVQYRRDSIVITTEMPTDEPMLRTRLKRPAASVRWCGSRVA